MGFMDTVAGTFSIDWKREGLDRVCATDIKRYNAEVHAQSAVEGLLDLRTLSAFSAEAHERMHAVERIELDVFDVAHQIIGGGDGSDKTRVRTKEQADHSLPYIAAVAWLDGALGPKQYEPERITREDVQDLMRRVVVRPDPELSARFPGTHGCRIRVYLKDGDLLTKEKFDYEGFHTRPMSWEKVVAKFRGLAEGCLEPSGAQSIIALVHDLECVRAVELGEALRELV